MHEPKDNKWLSFVVYIIAALLLGLDQCSKHFVSNNFTLGFSKPVIDPWLYFTFVTNDGAAFSIFKGQMIWLSVVAIAVVIGIVIYERRLPPDRPVSLLISLGFLLGGALGNLIDRLRLGYVIDFLDLHNQGHNIWPIFNVADISINVGVALLFLYYIDQSFKERKAETTSGVVPKNESNELGGS